MTTKAVLKHADSEGALLGERCSQPAASVSTLTSSLGEPQAERPCVEDLMPRRDSPEQLSPTDRDPNVGSSPSEGGLELEEAKKEDEKEGESYEEDILMGDDQVADFANSVLAAISCWHYKARALLSTHFTTDDRNRDLAEQESNQSEEAEICRQEEKHVDMTEKETLTTQVKVEHLRPLQCDPQAKKQGDQLEMRHSQHPESPVSSWQQEATTPEPQDSSRDTAEDEEGESDSSGLQVEEISVLTNGDHSEEEEEVLSGSNTILPSSALNQAGVIAERFISSLSRRSSLVSEDLGSIECSSPSIDNDIFKSPSVCMDLEEQTQMLASSSPELQVASAILSTPAPEPALSALIEEERKSTLSKLDRLLIHKIRRYYEHAEHQDANFSIKRRESLSYIPAGLVRHLSRQLSSGPQEPADPLHRKGLSRNRPTSWSVFDLPGLEKSSNSHKKTETRRLVEAKVRSHQSITDAFSTEEEFRPMSDMLKVWEDMDIEENQEVQQIVEEELNDSRLEAMQDISSDTSDVKTSKQLLPVLKDSERNVVSDGSSSPTTTFSALNSKIPMSQEKSHFNHVHLPKIINFRSSMEEDQILQDMGKMKNKVFQLARQYSQRIKNNRPMVWQRNRETSNQQGCKNMSDVQEEKVGKPKLRLALNSCDQVNIQEECSTSPVQTPNSPQSDTFSWPAVQELRTKYTSHSSKLTRSCTDPKGMQDCSTNRCNGCLHKYSSSSDLHKALPNCPAQSGSLHKEQCPEVEDRPQPLHQSLLCRWSSLDHMLGSLPIHEVDYLQEPVRTCYAASQVSLMTHESDQPQDEETALQESSDCITKPVALKTTESTFVKSLRDRFQSLSTTS